MGDPVLEKGGQVHESVEIEKKVRTVSAGVAESIGLRSSMEDTHVSEEVFGSSIGDGVERSLFAVFDGHGGDSGAVYARENLARILEGKLATGVGSDDAIGQSFLEIDRGIDESGFPYGCTAASALLENDTLTIANAGDTRVLLVRNDDGVETVERLSFDHTLQDENELQRVLATGARVGAGRIYVEGKGINVVRALGDKFFGDAVSPEPTISKHVLAPGKYRLVVECDGVWNGVPDEEVAGVISGKNPEEASAALVDKTAREMVGDNYTALVVDIEVF